MATDPATIPADDPERHVRLCDIPDAIRELREAADMWRSRYALTLTEVGEWERRYQDARSTVSAQRETIADLQREVYRLTHDETAIEIRRLRAEIGRLERENGSLLMERDAIEYQRVSNNSYLIALRDAANDRLADVCMWLADWDEDIEDGDAVALAKHVNYLMKERGHRITELMARAEAAERREEQVRRDLVQTLSDLDDARDRADRNESARHRLDAAMRLLDEIAREGLTECRHCTAGYRFRDLILDCYDPMASREDLEGALRAYEDAYGDPPDGCDDPKCWRGWDLGIEVPDVLRGED